MSDEDGAPRVGVERDPLPRRPTVVPAEPTLDWDSIEEASMASVGIDETRVISSWGYRPPHHQHGHRHGHRSRRHGRHGRRARTPTLIVLGGSLAALIVVMVIVISAGHRAGATIDRPAITTTTVAPATTTPIAPTPTPAR